MQTKTVGRGASEKRAIYERLADFRQRNGLGCFAEIERASRGKISEAELRAMLDAAPYPLAKWKVVQTALDLIEKKG